MLDKKAGLNTDLRLRDRLDHIGNRFLNANGGGSLAAADYIYFCLCQVINMHGVIPTVIHRALGLMDL